MASEKVPLPTAISAVGNSSSLIGFLFVVYVEPKNLLLNFVGRWTLTILQNKKEKMEWGGTFEGLYDIWIKHYQ